MCAHDVLVYAAGHLHVDTTTLEARLTQQVALCLYVRIAQNNCIPRFIAQNMYIRAAHVHECRTSIFVHCQSVLENC